MDHQYEIKTGDAQVAEIGKKWFRVRDTYGVQIAPGEDDALVLAVAIVIDQMAHPDEVMAAAPTPDRTNGAG